MCLVMNQLFCSKGLAQINIISFKLALAYLKFAYCGLLKDFLYCAIRLSCLLLVVKAFLSSLLMRIICLH